MEKRTALEARVTELEAENERLNMAMGVMAKWLDDFAGECPPNSTEDECRGEGGCIPCWIDHAKKAVEV
jgi:hypothetical protein